jgi:hypothetical protein
MYPEIPFCKVGDTPLMYPVVVHLVHQGIQRCTRKTPYKSKAVHLVHLVHHIRKKLGR